MLRHIVVLMFATAAAILVLGRSPVPQQLAYHLMADQRTLLGIPNCLNVVSNLPFAIVALLGFHALFGREAPEVSVIRDGWERWPCAVLFLGTALTTFGSGYYHLAPDNGRLVLDRLPMTLGFVGLLTDVVAERLSLRLARLVFGPLLLLGLGSVVWWYWSELNGRGDLRLYFLVQYGSLLVVLLLVLLYRAQRPGSGYVIGALGAYAFAKCLEVADEPIFALGRIVSGHTLKHVAAACAVACLVAMIRRRGGHARGSTLRHAVRRA